MYIGSEETGNRLVSSIFGKPQTSRSTETYVLLFLLLIYEVLDNLSLSCSIKTFGLKNSGRTFIIDHFHVLKNQVLSEDSII